VLDFGHKLDFVYYQFFELVFNEGLINNLDGEIRVGVFGHVSVDHLAELALSENFCGQFYRLLSVGKENNLFLGLRLSSHI
jgi:hypothetical protein